MERNLPLLAEFVKTCLQEGIAEKEVATSYHQVVTGGHIQESKITS